MDEKNEYGIDPTAYRIMIVDDIPVNTRLLEKILEHERFQLFVFNNSAQALESIHDVNPNVILLDVMMPGVDGLSFLTRVREMSEFDNTRIVMVSAVSEAEEVQKATNLGANDYLTKPINLKRVISTVYNQIKQIKQ